MSPVNCWYLLLNQVRRESKDHATLSDIYLNNVIMRLMQLSEDSTRMFKKVDSVHPVSVYFQITTLPTATQEGRVKGMTILETQIRG